MDGVFNNEYKFRAVKFFDYLYYIIYKLYSASNEKGARSASAGIIGGFQAMNVLTIIFIFQSVDGEQANVSKQLVVILFIVFQVFTYVRYIFGEKHSVDVIENKWLSKTELSKKQIRYSLFLYAIVSIISCFGLAIFLGSNK